MFESGVLESRGTPNCEAENERGSLHPALLVSKVLERFPWQNYIVPPAFGGRGSGVHGVCHCGARLLSTQLA